MYQRRDRPSKFFYITSNSGTGVLNTKVMSKINVMVFTPEKTRKFSRPIVKCGQSGFKMVIDEYGETTITHIDNPDFKLEIGGQSLWESFMDFQSFYMTWMEEITDIQFKSGLVQPQ